MASEQPPKTTKVFIDSSVLFAAAYSTHGPAGELLFRGIRGEAQLVISPVVLEETERDLARKAPAALPVFHTLREVLVAQQVEPTPAQLKEVIDSGIVALKDAPIVAGAIRAEAAYLASHDDRHLLSRRQEIKARFGVDAVSPYEVLVIIRAQR